MSRSIAFRNALRCIKTSHILNQGFKPHRCIQTFPRKCFSTETQERNSLHNIYVHDETENDPIKADVNRFTYRSYNCGQLRSENIGETVTLCGWVEFRRMNKFILLRDAYGQTQLIMNEKDDAACKMLEELPFESVIKIEGVVLARPPSMRNESQKTGDVEVAVEKLSVLNKATTTPFNVRNFQKANEALRMQYRYLDLRFPEMQSNMRLRSKLLMNMRDYLVNTCNFVDVETPTLFKATPGGAQEFVIPTRFPGQFYSLVQSPQQFKQILMAGGIDRYFQIARCYRDEGSRPDRQPEFTQLDIEMSFTTVEGVMQLTEEIMHFCLPEQPPLKFKRLKYESALEEYGSDKPDTRFDFKLVKLLNDDENSIYCVYFPGEFPLTRAIKDKLQLISKQYPKAKLITTKVDSGKNFLKPLVKLVGEAQTAKLVDVLNIPDESILFLSYGEQMHVRNLLGKVRTEFVYNLEAKHVIKEGLHFLWITDFPLFEQGDDPNALVTVHHPFTSPHPDDLHLLQEKPLEVRALAYDLVLNGYEIGGGSIRIHDQKLQETVLNMLNIERSSLEHMLTMLGSGCPPHGGIALGIDRIMAVLVGAKSIRDVIAFPKTFEGKDPLSGAPSAIPDETKKLYHIQSVDVK